VRSQHINQNRLGGKKRLFFPGKAAPRSRPANLNAAPGGRQVRTFALWRPFRKINSPNLLIRRTSIRKLSQPVPNQGGVPKFSEYVNERRAALSNVMRLAMYSFGTTLIFLTMPILLWPLVDMVLFPQGLKDAIQKERTFPHLFGDAHDAVSKLQKVAKKEQGKIIVLSGPYANELSNHYIQATKNSLPLDFRRLLWCHPYDWILYDHLPACHWQFFNAYTSLIIFISHNIAKTSPHTDAIMFLAYAFNKLEEALNKHEFKQKPSVIWKNADSPFLHQGGYNGDSENLKTYGQQIFQNMAILTGCEQRSATQIVTITQDDFALKHHYPAFTNKRCVHFQVDLDESDNFFLSQVSGDPLPCLKNKSSNWLW